MTAQPNITLEEAQEIVVTKTAPKITKESIEEKILAIDYYNHETLTICIITMKSGFKQIGSAAPASAVNYDQAVGERYAYEDAFRGLWKLEGYVLCETLANERRVRAM